MPCFNTVPYKRLQRVLCRSYKLYRQRRKTAHRALQALFLRFVLLNRCRYQTETSGYNAVCATLERLTAPGRTPAHTRYQRHAGTLYRPAQTAYYNKVYKGAGVRLSWIHARQCSRSQTISAHHGHPCGGRRGPIGGYRRSSFRAFAR